MTENFWHDLPKPFFILAPMEDVTDIAFRHVVAKAGAPDAYFTEFTNARSYNHPKGIDSVQGRLAFSEDEQPIVAHIWGDQPSDFAQMAKDMKKRGFKGIDINMGCPVKNVVSHGRGAGLIKDFDTAADLIQASKEGNLPVSVKTRLGFNKLEEMNDWIPHLLRQDIVNLTVHLRTRKEMSDPPAHWELIPDLVQMRDEIAPQTLITINGDIPDRQTGLDLVDKYGVDGVMIGRGIFHNPFAFEKVTRQHSAQDHLDLFKYHLDLFDQYQETLNRPFKNLRRSYKIYIRNMKNASKLRQALMETQNTEEARDLIHAFETQYL